MTDKIEWPDLPEGAIYKTINVTPMLVSLDGKTFYEVPEDMTLTEFLKGLKRDD